jgi:adenine-specific DNA-methyltransferase
LSGWCRPATLRGMAGPERQQQVLELLKGLRGIEPLKQLFWSELNYQRVNEPLSRRGWTDSAAQALADDPVLFAGGGENNDFHVIYGRLASERLLLGAERPVVSRLVREHPYALFVFSNKTQDRWHFLNVKYDKAVERRQLFRRITVVPGDGLRTAGERIALLNLEEIGADRSPLTIQEHHDAAFDVEKVTKDFYAEIANWYFWACDHVTFPMPKGTANAEAYKAQSLIRLITRLIFCWFVKEKGLIPGELFDSRALAKLLKAGAALPASEETTYYKAILQNLFFATLNQEMGKREFRKRNAHGRDPHRGITNLYRYEDAFADPKAFLRLMDGIPFLNGGLFECLDKVYRAEEKLPDVRIDGFSDHPKNPLSVPDFLFFGDERTVDLEKAYGEKRYRQATVRGLIHTFGRYKFTITENTPLDQEVALDPELSGKVFENLLAAYNPETATTARKQTGSFYTPREIVDYMVDEALLAYLETALRQTGPQIHTDETRMKSSTTTNIRENLCPSVAKNGYEARLRHLFAYNDEPHQFSPAEVKTLIAAIDNLKALDPACGSGAFPMGLLHKLVFILGKLDPHNEQWKQQQIAKASEIPDATVREKTLADIEQAFAANELDYGRKLYLIENCIYGVDIQPIAVQIAKMRFFISLIVDQKVAQASSLRNDSTRNQDGCATLPADNLGIRPLPNLETKFVAANTLIGIEKPAQQMLRNPQIDAKEAELRQVRERHFTARTPATKARCREQDAKLRAEISELLRADGFARETTEKLANWNPYDQNASADFFDPEWMFGLREGFDIVTGNPPYVRQEEIKELKPALQAQGYTCHTGTADLYVYFYERALQILHDGGVLSFISSNKFFRSAYGEKLRGLLAKQTIHRIIDFGDAPVFTAIAYPAILILSKAPVDGHNVRALNWELGPPIEQFPDIARSQSFHIAQTELKPDGWRLESPAIFRLLAKFRTAGKPLGGYVQNAIYMGIKTGLNQAFVVDRATRDRLIAEHKSSAEVLKPFLRGRDVKRWRVEFADQYLIKIESSENKQHPWSGKPRAEAEKVFAKTYPAIHAWLENSRRDLIARDDQGSYFWELRSCVYWQEFEQPKILYPDIYEHQSLAWDERGYFAANTCYFIPTSEKWLTGLLNSQAVEWFYSNISNKVRGGYMRSFTDYMTQIPIPSPSRAEHDALVKLVKRILAAKRANPRADTSAWEREIDERVYRLYGLTAAEIKIVEEDGRKG